MALAWFVWRSNTKTAERTTATAENKLRLDLFDKRYKVFEVIRTFVAEARWNEDPNKDEVYVVRNRIAEAKFLFGDDVAAYVEGLEQLADALQEAIVDSQNPDESQRPALVKAKVQALRAFIAEGRKAADKFLPYLDFRELRSGRPEYSKKNAGH